MTNAHLPKGWEMVIGLEVHAQLQTQSKLFGRASTAFGAPANSQVDPVSLGLPGALPVLNREALRLAAIAGFATNCQVHSQSVFERKNYFYADLPKGYQISQFHRPICTDGLLKVRVDGHDIEVGIHQIHMEEDAGKSTHTNQGSLVDLNRAGIALIEIVSEPDLRTPEQAVAYLKELRAILLYTKVSDGSLEQGSFRCDANVSVRKVGVTELGTRCEIKNLNSFRAIRDAIVAEANRQIRRLKQQEPITQQTRLWNADKGRTEAMRGKEQAHDYRYVPDPDLPVVVIDSQRLEQWKADLPELPAQRRARYMEQLSLDEHTAWFLCEEPDRARRFETMLGSEQSARRAKSIGSFLSVRLAGAINRAARQWHQIDLVLVELAEVHDQWRDGLLSNKMLTDLLHDALSVEDDIESALANARAKVGLIEQDLDALRDVIDQLIEANPKQASAYRAGKEQLFGFFMGQVMKALKGKANAKDASAALRQALQSLD